MIGENIAHVDFNISAGKYGPNVAQAIVRNMSQSVVVY